MATFRGGSVAWMIVTAIATWLPLPAGAVEIPWADDVLVSTLAPGARSVAAGDIDGDGDIDFVTASADNDTIAWFENDGSQSFTRRVISDTADGASAVKLADINDDGDLDVVFASELDDTVGWAENLGTSPLVWMVHELSTDPDGSGAAQGYFDGARSVAPADVDRDGDVDIVAASYNDDTVGWLENRLNEPTADWAPGIRNITLSADGAISMAVGDLDGDGDPDVAVAAANGPGYLWFEGDGTPLDGGWTRHELSTTQDPNWVDIADINGDGALDVIGTALETGVTWYQSATSTERVISSQADLFGALAVDLDQDGDTDVLRFTSEDEWGWDENDGSPEDGGWIAHTISETFPAAVAIPGDLDGDGDPDVVSASPAGTAAWFENLTIHRSAVFAEQNVIDLVSSGESVFAADVDGDGDQDVLGASRTSNTIAWYANTDGSGTFGSQQVISAAADGVWSVFAVDVDGDGDIDALSASGDIDTIAWHENTTGSGSAWTERVISTSAASATSVSAADLDGDGDQDVLSASFFDDKIAWYENLGPDDGTTGECSPSVTPACFGAQGVISASTGRARFVIAADVDGDGDVDALSASQDAPTIAWHENSAGDGSAWVSHAISTVAVGAALSVHAADVDGDGDLDALAAVGADDASVWFENTDGSGTFGPQQVIAAGNNPWSVVTADVDADGDLDAVSAFRSDNTIAWHENSAGDGSAWTSETISAATSATKLATADVDGDGALDVLVASIGWFPNRGGQFALPTTDTAQNVIVGGQTEDVLRIESFHRGRTGDGDMELNSLHLLFESSPGVPLTDAQYSGRIGNVAVYRDDGSGIFEELLDTPVSTVESVPFPDSGERILTFTNLDSSVQLVHGTSKVFFVAVTPTSSSSTFSYMVTHLTESSSEADDRTYNTPLILEWVENTASASVSNKVNTSTCTSQGDLNLQNVNVTTSLLCEAGTILSAVAMRTYSGATMVLRAGEGISLGNNFRVDNGGSLSIQFDPALQP